MKSWSFVLVGGLCASGILWLAPLRSAVGAAPPAKATLGVAVIDLDVVAKRLGRDVEILEAVKKLRENYNKQLAELKAKLQAEYDAKKKSLGDKPTDAQKRELVTVFQQMSGRLNGAQNQANQQINAYRQKMAMKVRADMLPFAQQAAKERGLDVIITRNYVYHASAAADITDRVVLLALQAKKKTPPAPKPKK